MTRRIASPDTDADDAVRACLNATPPQSFVMVAGAGSGKTTSLVKALAHLVEARGHAMVQAGQRVACITYTEVAAEEIAEDVANTAVCLVSTIHSFLWTLIRSFTADIKEWLTARIIDDVAAQQEKIAKPRTRETTKIKARARIDRLTAQMSVVAAIERFGYATGSDYARGILGHDDVVKCALALLSARPLLRSLLAAQYPIVFVDESQDTNPDFVAALKSVQVSVSPPFCIGVFGDPMQKIYLAGIGQIRAEPGWQSITKPENFRSPQTVLSLINRIRMADDGLQQSGGRKESAAQDATLVAGSARIFLLPADGNRDGSLAQVRHWIARANADPHWGADSGAVKVLVLVHRSAAARLGFASIYAALNDHGDHGLKQGLRDGSAWILRPFLTVLLPLIDARRLEQEQAVIQLLLAHAPAMEVLRSSSADTLEHLQRIDFAVGEIASMIGGQRAATIGDVLSCAIEHKIIAQDDRLAPFLAASPSASESEEDSDDTSEDVSITAFLGSPAAEIAALRGYIQNQSPFDTHQGIKGAEFDRVLVVLDDDEARYNLFSYSRFFGLEPPSETDLENARAGKETTIDRTRRLFYVCCSRARLDLAVALFVANPDRSREKVVATKIFQNDQVFTLSEMRKTAQL